MIARFYLPCLLVVSTPQSTGGFDAGVHAYRHGRFADALTAFTATDAGAQATPELAYNRALAALQSGNLGAADSASEQMATRGGAAFKTLRDFLAGNLAFARCALARRQAGAVESEPFAFDAAIALAEAAATAWQDVVMQQPDWPHARRNAERAARMLARLHAERAAAEARKNKAKKEPDAPKPKLPPPGDSKKPTPEKDPADELSAQELRRLLDKLARKEREKLQLRQATQQAASVEVQRDW